MKMKKLLPKDSDPFFEKGEIILSKDENVNILLISVDFDRYFSVVVCIWPNDCEQIPPTPSVSLPNISNTSVDFTT